jgi:YtkA-like
MHWKSILLAIAFFAPIGCAAFAGADDYAFEAVNAEIKSSNVATIAVRLVYRSTGKPVVGATIIQTRLDMAPNGMADMATVVVPLPSPAPGVYAFKAPLTMAGRWLFTISVKVQDELEPLTGKLNFRVLP